MIILFQNISFWHSINCALINLLFTHVLDLLRWNTHWGKGLFSAYTARFFGHIAALCSLKKPSREKKLIFPTTITHHNKSIKIVSIYQGDPRLRREGFYIGVV